MLHMYCDKTDFDTHLTLGVLLRVVLGVVTGALASAAGVLGVASREVRGACWDCDLFSCSSRIISSNASSASKSC